MADSIYISSNSPAPVFRNTAGGEGKCPLRDGHIIDATVPLV